MHLTIKGIQFILVLLVSSLVSCRAILPDHLKEANKDALQAAESLDLIAADLEEYGTVSASTARVILNPGDHFAFDLDLSAQQIFDRERIEAASSITNIEALEARVAISLDLLRQAGLASNPAEASRLQGQAQGVLASSLVGAVEGGMTTNSPPKAKPDSSSTPTPPPGKSSPKSDPMKNNTPAEKSPSPTPKAMPDPSTTKKPQPHGPPISMSEDNLAKKALPSEKFSSGQKTRDPDTLNLSLRQLIQLVFNDHITLKLFEWLSKPDDEEVANQMVYAAILNVSVRPGRRTYTGYVGEIDVRVEYGVEDSHGKFQRGKGHPLTYAVFPALDSQVLDLRNNIRKQLALALLFRAQGKELIGEGQLDYVRRLEQDAASVTALNTVVGYNSAGRHFGWRFSPGFVAQADPADKDTPPGYRLQPQSFPALILILADKDDLPENLGGTNTSAPKEENGRYMAPYSHFIFHSSMRWLRAPAASADESWVPFSRTIDRFRHPRLEETQVMEWAISLEHAREQINRLPKSPFPYVRNTLSKRLNLLESASVGSDSYWSIPQLPLTSIPTFSLSSIAPRQGWIDKKSWFVVKGIGLTNTTEFYVGGVKANEVRASADGRAAVFSIAESEFNSSTTQLVDVVAYSSEEKKGKRSLLGAVKFSLRQPPTPSSSPAEPKAKIEVTWGTGVGGARQLTSLIVHGDVKPEEVLRAITRQASKGDTDVDVTIDVEAKEGK